MPAAAMAEVTSVSAPANAQIAGAPVPVAPSHLPALAFAPCPATAPVRRVVSILQGSIAALEKQAKAKSKGTTKDLGDSKFAHLKSEDLSSLLEFTWDLTKQVMGIAVLSENEAKKQARKDSALRKSQDLQLVHEVLLVLACMEEINVNRTNFLSGANGINPINAEDVEAIDKLCPQLSRRPVIEEGAPSFQEHTLNAAKQVLAIIEGDTKEVFGTTYANLKDVIRNVNEYGYFDHPRENVVEIEVEEMESPVKDEITENIEQITPPLTAPIVPVNPPPPAPQVVPAPAFSILPPRAPPVTLQQVEHAYFAQQYGHQQQPPQQHQPVPEVFGPQSFIFIQDSELDSADISQQPTPRPASPASIPSQTFTNQNFSIPQHFTPDPNIPQNPHIPLNDVSPPVVHYPANVNDVQNAITNFSTPNAPPIPLPAPHPPIPPHIPIPPGQVVTHPHTIQQRLPSPSFQQTVPFKPQPTHPTEPIIMQMNDMSPEENKASTPIEPEPTNNEWNDTSKTEIQPEQLEIDEWIPETVPSESVSQSNGQTSEKFRHRARGRGGNSGSYRGRGGYQNGRSGSYYRNNDNQTNNTVNGGGNYDNYRENRNDGNRFENSHNYQGSFRGRSSNGRGSHRQNGGTRGSSRNAPPRGTGGSRPQYIRKPANNTNNQFVETRNGIDSNNKQTFAH